MIIDLALVLIPILIIISLIDIKFHKVPSILLTGMIFVVAMIQIFSPTNLAYFHLAGGVVFFVFAWLLYEAEFIGGIADVKVITIIGLMIGSYPMLLVGVILILLFGFIYKVGMRIIAKKKFDEEIPFIPCLFLVYLTLYLIQGRLI